MKDYLMEILERLVRHQDKEDKNHLSVLGAEMLIKKHFGDKPRWCEHIKDSNSRYMNWKGRSGNSFSTGLADEFNFCPICGKEKPNEN